MMLAVAEQLGEELGATPAEKLPPGWAAGNDRPEPWGPADARNAQLVLRLSRVLAGIATAAAERADEAADAMATERMMGALARTELVIRGELMRGDEATLREQLPGFVFMVVLPGAGMDQALALANRTTVLLEKGLE
jgi:hypothetical protein